MKERILFECVGQCGGNIGRLLMNKGYICHFINTSTDDLRSLEMKDGFRYHVPNATGCNKDRKKAMFYAKDYYDHMVNVIDSRFSEQDIVFFVFSLGGGTGSGISPVLLDYLSRKNRNKSYGAIVILPSLSESIKSQINAVECYKQLESIENLKSIYVIDNNNGDEFQLNQDFVNQFDRLVNITKVDTRSIIDQAELETLLTCKGMSVIGDLYETNQDGQNRFLFDRMIFTPYEKGCKYLGILSNYKVNVELLEQVFGVPLDVYVGYCNEIEKPFIISTGMNLYSSRILSLIERVKSKQFERINPQNELNIEVPIIEEYPPKIRKEDNGNKVNFDDIFGKFIG